MTKKSMKVITNRVTVHILLRVIQLYRAVRICIYPYRTCMFIPSCSEYTLMAIKKFGLLRGVFYSARRLLLCCSFFHHK